MNENYILNAPIRTKYMQIKDNNSTKSSKIKTMAGFSKRFVWLLDKANFPLRGRNTRGEEVFGIRAHTFGQMCQADIIRSFPETIEICKVLLKDIPGDYDPISVTSWLFAGESAPNPFKNSREEHQLFYEVYALIKKLAESKNMSVLPSTISKVTESVCQYIEQSGLDQDIDPAQHEDVLEIINSQLVLIKSGITA